VECQRNYEAAWRLKNIERLRIARKKRLAMKTNYHREYNAKNRGILLVREAMRRAVNKGLPCDLQNYIETLAARVHVGRCEMTGVTLNLRASVIEWNSPSLDRIVPKKGYVYSNIRVVCFAMNASLGNWGESILRSLMSVWLAKEI